MIDVEMTMSLMTLMIVAFHAGSTIAVVRMLVKRQDKLEKAIEDHDKEIWELRIASARN